MAAEGACRLADLERQVAELEALECTWAAEFAMDVEERANLRSVAAPRGLDAPERSLGAAARTAVKTPTNGGVCV